LDFTNAKVIWIRFGCIGLEWTRLDWTGLDQTTFDRIRSDQITPE